MDRTDSFIMKSELDMTETDLLVYRKQIVNVNWGARQNSDQICTELRAEYRQF